MAETPTRPRLTFIFTGVDEFGLPMFQVLEDGELIRCEPKVERPEFVDLSKTPEFDLGGFRWRYKCQETKYKLGHIEIQRKDQGIELIDSPVPFFFWRYAAIENDVMTFKKDTLTVRSQTTKLIFPRGNEANPPK